MFPVIRNVSAAVVCLRRSSPGGSGIVANTAASHAIADCELFYRIAMHR